MITPGYYEIECDVCHKKEFFPEGEDATLVGDWYYGIPDDGGHFCTDCWSSQENTRDDRAAQGIAELEMVPYASSIRDNLNGEW